jgi:hypothetical protein
MFPSAGSVFTSLFFFSFILLGMVSNTQNNSGNAFDANCKECTGRHFDTQWIECQCLDGAGEWKFTTLDLSKSGSSFG